MRHAVLGAGGVGGLLAAALSHSGYEVVALMRESTLSRYPGRFGVESQVLGSYSAEVPASAQLDRAVDVLWVAAKSTSLEAALDLAPADRVGGATVIPLLNGVDHLALLRAHYPKVVAGALRAETERIDDGQIVQRSPFVRIDIVGEPDIVRDVAATGIDCGSVDDEVTLLWQKLAFLAPLALATTAAEAPLGAIRDTDLYQRAQLETITVALAQGAEIDEGAIAQLSAAASDQMRSSMQRDLAAGHVLELDAIAGPILRGGRLHGIDTPATAALVHQVETRVRTRDEVAT